MTVTPVNECSRRIAWLVRTSGGMRRFPRSTNLPSNGRKISLFRCYQFYVDFVESENSNGFHAPQEATRILGEAIDSARQGQLALRPLPKVAQK